MNCLDIELAIASYFDPRRNMIVPNVSWGMNLHECDLLIMTKSRYLYEIEIKISKSDLKKDLEKRHGHKSNKIKRLYFAMPEHLRDCAELIPERAGIILVIDKGSYRRCNTIRPAKDNNESVPLTIEESFNLARLGVLRIFPLKKKLRDAAKPKI
jgi:hypothetical protein